MEPVDGSLGVPRRILVVVSILFFLSGTSGLVYQVLWMRSLSLFFGSDMYGVSIILSAFMGGLALGSFGGGQFAERTERPLFWYGVAELGVGAFAFIFPSLLDVFDPWLRSAYPGAPGSSSAGYLGVRILVSTGALVIPTVLMGATLPLIMHHVVRRREALGELAAHFYAVNTLGALTGTLGAGFILIPYLGTSRATVCAAAINLVVGACSVSVGLRARRPSATSSAEGTAGEEHDPLPGHSPAQRRRLARAAVIALGVSGFGSFALEVIWTRILLISFSATVYSFASMLACFLFGIFVGSRLVGRIVDRHQDPLGLFAGLELGIGLSVGILCLVVNAVPGLFGRLMGAVAQLLGEGRDHTLVVSTLAASLLLLFVPTTLLGATFSVALRAYTTNIARAGSRAGNLYAANTMGAIFGSLSAGLVAVPLLGTTLGLALTAALFTSIGLSLSMTRAAVYGASWVGSRSLAVAVVAVVLAGASVTFPYRVRLNFNQTAEGELIYHAEGVQNTIDVIRSESGSTALIIGGNVEADDSYLQRRHFVLKGHLPLLLMDAPRTVLVVGLGMGITLQATARHPGLERTDVIELSPEILAAQTSLADVNGDVVNDPLVNVRIDDGRVFMKLGEGRYDMITADPIHPKVSRVGYLYTREYYESIRSRLNDEGVVCQWMPIYQIAPRRLRSAVATFLDVFPEASLWYVANHALLIAKKHASRIDFEALRGKLEDPKVREDLSSIGIPSAEVLLSHLIMGPAELRAYVDAGGDVPLNSDSYPYLEYFVPRDLFRGTVDNLREFVKFLANPADYAERMPPKSRARLDRLVEGRAERMLEDAVDRPRAGTPGHASPTARREWSHTQPDTRA
ncbi:MAG: fused MFS/spermidine synthase [Myxococcota bacterium]